MRFGISADFLHRPGNGWQTYMAELLPAMLAIDGCNEYHVFVSRSLDERQFPFLKQPNLITHVAPDAAWIRLPFSLPWLAYKHRLDLLHVQHAGPPCSSCPLVTTIHDLSFELRPDLFTPTFRFRLAVGTRITARRAASIITISEATKRDVIETYRVPEGRITTIHLACGKAFRPVSDDREIERVRSAYRTSPSYILFVGEIHPRKNVHRLIEAYGMLRRDYGIQHKLVIAGAHWRSNRVLEAANHEDVRGGIEFTGYVASRDLPALYSGAAMFAFLSEFEGFGLAMLEAMSCGLPVLISKNAALCEIAGPACVSVDPNNTDEVALAMYRILNERGLRHRLAAAALERARAFSWEQVARRTLEIYRQAVA